MTVVADSGPLIHLAIVGQFLLLKHCFHNLYIIPHIYDEVVTQGNGRPGDAELRQAILENWITNEPATDLELQHQIHAPNISDTGAAIIATGLERNATLILTDDFAVRGIAERKGLLVMGTIGILTQACVEGLIPSLKPLLDQLIHEGFYLDPTGSMYQDALRHVKEM